MHQFTEILTLLITDYGILAVFILMTLESALIPIPSEITMTFAGFLSGLGIFNFWVVVLVGAVGNLVGSLLAYWLGVKMGEKWIRNAIRKWGMWVLIKEKDYDVSLLWFNKYGQGVAFVSRLLPIVRTFISLPAGIAKMSIVKFSILTFVGSFLWSLVLAFLGLKLGQNWETVGPFFRQFQYLIILTVSLGVFYYINTHLKVKK